MDLLIDEIAERLGRTVDFLEEVLGDPTLCRDITASKQSIIASAPAPEIPFYVASDGIPYSRTNDTWNRCIRGNVTLTDIRNNIVLDRDEAVIVDCAAYHTGGVWRHPDTDMFFTYTPASKGKAMTLLIPQGYVVTKNNTVVFK